jgi:hypothetical protein
MIVDHDDDKNSNELDQPHKLCLSNLSFLQPTILILALSCLCHER